MPTSTDTVDITLSDLGARGGIAEATPDHAKVVAFAERYLDGYTPLNWLCRSRTRQFAEGQGCIHRAGPEDLVDFDAELELKSSYPGRFRIRINQRGSGRSYLQWNGVFIGDPLTDNIADPDGYRFHDVFHFAYSAILHWSPSCAP